MGQYEVDQFDPTPDPDLVCVICHCIYEDALETPCHHIFCRGCINRWLERRPTCPTCRTRIIAEILEPAPARIRTMLNLLMIRCANIKNGCRTISLELYPEHTNNCAYEMLKCTFPNCEVKVIRRDLQEHEQDCGWRQICCMKDCGLLYPVKERETHNCVQALKDSLSERNRLFEELQKRATELEELTTDLRAQLTDVTRQLNLAVNLRDDLSLSESWVDDYELDYDDQDAESITSQETTLMRSVSDVSPLAANDSADANLQPVPPENVLEDHDVITFNEWLHRIGANEIPEVPAFTADTIMPIYNTALMPVSASNSTSGVVSAESGDSPLDSVTSWQEMREETGDSPLDSVTSWQEMQEVNSVTSWQELQEENSWEEMQESYTQSYPVLISDGSDDEPSPIDHTETARGQVSASHQNEANSSSQVHPNTYNLRSRSESHSGEPAIRDQSRSQGGSASYRSRSVSRSRDRSVSYSPAAGSTSLWSSPHHSSDSWEPRSLSLIQSSSSGSRRSPSRRRQRRSRSYSRSRSRSWSRHSWRSRSASRRRSICSPYRRRRSRSRSPRRSGQRSRSRSPRRSRRRRSRSPPHSSYRSRSTSRQRYDNYGRYRLRSRSRSWSMDSSRSSGSSIKSWHRRGSSTPRQSTASVDSLQQSFESWDDHHEQESSSPMKGRWVRSIRHYEAQHGDQEEGGQSGQSATENNECMDNGSDLNTSGSIQGSRDIASSENDRSSLDTDNTDDRSAYEEDNGSIDYGSKLNTSRSSEGSHDFSYSETENCDGSFSDSDDTDNTINYEPNSPGHVVQADSTSSVIVLSDSHDSSDENGDTPTPVPEADKDSSHSSPCTSRRGTRNNRTGSPSSSQMGSSSTSKGGWDTDDGEVRDGCCVEPGATNIPKRRGRSARSSPANGRSPSPKRRCTRSTPASPVSHSSILSSPRSRSASPSSVISNHGNRDDSPDQPCSPVDSHSTSQAESSGRNESLNDVASEMESKPNVNDSGEHESSHSESDAQQRELVKTPKDRSVHPADSDSSGDESATERGRPWLASGGAAGGPRKSSTSNGSDPSLPSRNLTHTQLYDYVHGYIEYSLNNFVNLLQQGTMFSSSTTAVGMPPCPLPPSNQDDQALRSPQPRTQGDTSTASAETGDPIPDVEVPGAALLSALTNSDSESEGEDYVPDNDSHSSGDVTISDHLSDDVEEGSPSPSSNPNSDSDNEGSDHSENLSYLVNNSCTSDDSDGDWSPGS